MHCIVLFLTLTCCLSVLHGPLSVRASTTFRDSRDGVDTMNLQNDAKSQHATYDEPIILVDKKMTPTNVTVGAVLHVELVLYNIGDQDAHNIHIEDAQLPKGFTLTSSSSDARKGFVQDIPLIKALTHIVVSYDVHVAKHTGEYTIGVAKVTYTHDPTSDDANDTQVFTSYSTVLYEDADILNQPLHTSRSGGSSAAHATTQYQQGILSVVPTNAYDTKQSTYIKETIVWMFLLGIPICVPYYFYRIRSAELQTLLKKVQETK